jgi:imidazolonepropionase
MTPEEAIAAATVNGAYAMGLESTHGTISAGKRASFFITSPSLAYLPYSFGHPAIEATYINGEKVWSA